ncbi:hypothetical protein [Sinorhizobium medicae]|uniref:hypothetical protein n=1 Tax=Sinorhizobium medicae TaxID=110321 RepID=UPI00048041FF|nr:hypothetical protein [Sinorhizobium medicae]
MAREPKAGKSETLTIRLDPKTRFILEYLSRLKGQTITTVVERAIVAAASQEYVPDPKHPDPDGWQYFWDVSDGVRALRMAERSEFFPTYEEEKRLQFCREHWPFFWSSKERNSFLNYYVDVLWPNIDTFVQIHEDQKANDYFAAGKAMRTALTNAKLRAPDWPIKDQKEDKSKIRSGGEFSRDLDDDIPF